MPVRFIFHLGSNPWIREMMLWTKLVDWSVGFTIKWIINQMKKQC